MKRQKKIIEEDKNLNNKNSKSLPMSKRILILIFLSILGMALIWLYGKLLEVDFVKQRFNFLYITLEESDHRSFLNAVWQVQTSISILTITFITLIMGRLHTQIHGFKLNEIMLLNKSRFNYWEKVWINIATVGLNFFYVSIADTSSVTLTFLISLILTLSLLKESLHILRTPEDFEEVVERYIYQELDRAIEAENISNDNLNHNSSKK